MDLIPIKVKIGLKPNGHALYPDWTKLAIVQESGLGENYKPDKLGGWKYDKVSGHQEATEDSPIGMQYGMLLVDERFATEAVEEFPDVVSVMTSKEAESFYNERVTVRMPENKVDVNVLTALKAELDLAEAIGKDTNELKQKIAKALDPNDNEAGIRENKIKTFAKLLDNTNAKVKNINIAS